MLESVTQELPVVMSDEAISTHPDQTRHTSEQPL